jgi:chromatin remodeling complex protein RSC6
MNLDPCSLIKHIYVSDINNVNVNSKKEGKNPGSKNKKTLEREARETRNDIQR